MSEFAIFIEGGGNSRREQAPLRIGFQKLFEPVLSAARERRIRHRVIVCGGRSETIKLFLNEIRLQPETKCFLLVDSEEIPLAGISAVDHLAGRDDDRLRGVDDDMIGMMIAVMESWIVSDQVMLQSYFGPGFRMSSLPAQQNLEAVSKLDICERLANATRDSQKGTYHKQRHGPELIGNLDREILKRRCPAFGTFESAMRNSF